MLLEPLVSTIETIKERIATHGASLRQNETRTRTALIDPLLTALGWDTADPALITPEYRVDVGWADYALAGVGNQPVAVIEAKRLGSVVENHLEQAVGYCIQQGIAYAGVTDGNRWQLYRTFEPVPLADKLVLDVSIADATAHEAALKLLLLWRPNLASGQPVAANAPVLSFHRSGETVLVGPNPLQDEKPESTETMPTEVGWKPIGQVTPSIGDPRPNAIRIEQGPAIAISRWNQVLIEIAEWLCKQGLLTYQNCPVSVGPSRYLLALAPRHKSGRDFAKPRKISSGIYLELDYTGKDFLRHIRTLLDGLNISTDSVELRFG